MAHNELSFGPFRFNIAQRELQRDGARVQLGSRALDILCVLASANGEVVSKDELMTRVWPGLVVEENNIQVHVSALRKALDERTSGQSYIVTVPSRGYRLIGLQPPPAGAPGAFDVRSELTLPDKPSIAVMPFQNLSGDPSEDYFADGMVDEIITALSRIRWLFVIARSSTLTYKGQAVSVKQVRRELGVHYVLEGSLRKGGGRVRITAQLIDALSGVHLWADRYDRDLTDIFAVQDEITMRVIGAIEPSLLKAEIARIKRQRPNNLNAYDLVLRTLPFVCAAMPKEAEKAIPLLEDALKLEPNYGAAHAYLSWCFHARFRRGGFHQEDRVAAIHHARAAIAFGADDATALAIAAFVIVWEEHDTTTALKLFDRALELSNSNEFALGLSAVTLAWMGRTELAVERAQLALRLSPFDPLSFRPNQALAIAYFHMQRYADAADAAQSAINSNPVFSIPRAVLTAALVRLGRIEEAKMAAREVLECEPTFAVRRTSVLSELEPAVFKAFADAWHEAGLPE